MPPIEYKSIRYQQDDESLKYGADGNCGWLVAIDPETGARLWVVKIYHVSQPTKNAPTDGGYLWFGKFEVAAENKLRIETEVGSAYLLDLNTREVKSLTPEFIESKPSKAYDEDDGLPVS